VFVTFSFLSLLGWGWLIVAAMMTVLWLIQYVRKDAGVVDVGWSAGLGLLALFYGFAADGYLPRRFLVTTMATLWAFRLATYLLSNRVIGKAEDGRYQTLRRDWGKRAHLYFFIFFQAQALLDVAFSLSFLVIATNPQPAISVWEVAAVPLWLLAISGEWLADWQLARFRSDVHNQGKTCRDGLWRYSRHPNYFFEWLHWWCYVLMAIGLPAFWLTLVAPALLLYLLFKITGIPATEAQAVRSRGDDYRTYQRTTSAFLPWLPRREVS
jgi:steroid 5-alpha reductase family enzyme